jgi:hypothetical protein
MLYSLFKAEVQPPPEENNKIVKSGQPSPGHPVNVARELAVV